METAKILNIKKTSSQIHDEAMSAAKNLKNEYIRLFEILLEVEKGQIYYDCEVTSLYTYCVEFLELSSHIAYEFITVVRKALEIPEFAESIKSGKVAISKARRICSVISKDDFQVWIDLAESCTCRVIERAVAQANPRTIVSETMKYVAENILEFKLAIDEEWKELLRETKDILSQQHKSAINSEEALRTLMKAFVKENSAVEKSKRALKKQKLKVNRDQHKAILEEEILLDKERKIENLDNSDRKQKRNLPAAIEHKVNLRDQGQCTFVS